METITQTLEEAVQQAMALGSSLLIIGAALSIIPYILFAIGLSNAAKRYGLRNQWMAWVPIARKHLLAEMADLRRFQTRKQKKLTTQFEIITCLCLACIYGISRTNNPVFIMITAILMILLSYNQVFSYYYFYRLRDQENATIYFILGLMGAPLNSIFVYHCR